MQGEKAMNLIKELDRHKDSLPMYNFNLVNQVCEELQEMGNELARKRRADDTLTVFDPSVRVMFAIIQRNVRCLLAYHYNRLMFIKNMRWEFGSIIPQEMKANMSASEIEWMSSYSNNLTRYMRSLGENGMNLQIDLKPPKSVYIDVKCLVDYGTLELSDGTVVLLKKNSMHYLPRVECEDLIRRGVFEHIMY